MKKLFIVTAITLMVLGFSLKSQASLLNRGTDTLGNRLIYDSDLNITWYDYTYSYTNYSQTSWYNALSWAGSLTVILNGIEYDDWRLPTITINQDPPTYGYSGLNTYGYNITNSEMGHLFYIELGNKAYYATDGTNPQDGWGLKNTGPFEHLYASGYYTDMTYAYNVYAAVYHEFSNDPNFTGNGSQYAAAKEALGGTGVYAMAVLNGDVSAVPVPGAFWLLASGFAGLGTLRWKKFKKTE